MVDYGKVLLVMMMVTAFQPSEELFVTLDHAAIDEFWIVSHTVNNPSRLVVAGSMPHYGMYLIAGTFKHRNTFTVSFNEKLGQIKWHCTATCIKLKLIVLYSFISGI